MGGPGIFDVVHECSCEGTNCERFDEDDDDDNDDDSPACLTGCVAPGSSPSSFTCDEADEVITCITDECSDEEIASIGGPEIFDLVLECSCEGLNCEAFDEDDDDNNGNGNNNNDNNNGEDFSKEECVKGCILGPFDPLTASCADAESVTSCLSDECSEEVLNLIGGSDVLDMVTDCACEQIGCEVFSSDGEGNSGDKSEYPSVDPVNLVNPTNHSYYSQLHAGAQFHLRHFESNDSLAKFFRHEIYKPGNTWESSPWDKFSAFADFRYDYDESSSRCVPFVKLTDSPEEAFARLVSVDGVDADCFMDSKISEYHARCVNASSFDEMNNGNNNNDCWQSLDQWSWDALPTSFLADIRSTLRAVTGAAPPTELDGADESVVIELFDAETGEVAAHSTMLTHQKYLSSQPKVHTRFNDLQNSRSKCSVFPNLLNSDGSILYDGPWAENWYGQPEPERQTVTAPGSCPRTVNGVSTPRLELNSPASAGPIDETKFSIASVVRISDALTGASDKNGYIENLPAMASCQVYIGGIYDADGFELCRNLNNGYSEKGNAPVKEPFCDFEKLMETTTEMEAVLALIGEGKVPADSAILLPYLGSDAFGSCSFLIDQALTFKDVSRTIVSQECTEDYWDELTNEQNEQWLSDPCCNWELMNSMCCAPRERSVKVSNSLFLSLSLPLPPTHPFSFRSLRFSSTFSSSLSLFSLFSLFSVIFFPVLLAFSFAGSGSFGGHEETSILLLVRRPTDLHRHLRRSGLR